MVSIPKIGLPLMAILIFQSNILITQNTITANLAGISTKQPKFGCGGVYMLPGNEVNKVEATCTSASPAYINKYRRQDSYIPSANDPVITVKITFHIFNKSDGTGSWPATAPGINDLSQIAAWMHDGYERFSDPRVANYTPAGWTPPNYIHDSKINYELTNIYFYNDNTLNTTTNDAAFFSHINSLYPGRIDEGLPIFFNNSTIAGIAGHAGNNGVPFVHTQVGSPSGLYFAFMHLKHEIGHCMGLGHTYDIVPGTGSEYDFGHPCSDFDFLYDVFPINNGCSTNLGCGACWENGTPQESNNMMSGGNDLNVWISPLQMGRRIKNMHLNIPGYQNNIRKYAKEMTSSAIGAWQITASELWDFDIQMYQDIIVKSGATLTIKCKVGMANNGRIIVERGAKLIIDGGEINAWGTSWAGIQVWGTTAQKQTVVSGMATNHGILQIINQGIVKDAVNAVSTIKYDENGVWDMGGYTGGIIQCDGAKFVNNKRAVQFLTYHNKNNGGLTIDNIGYIRRSTFETNATLKSGNAPDEFVSLTQVEGIKLVGNIYQNTRSPLPLIDQRGKGISSVDASFYVDRYKICQTYDVNTGECAVYSTNVPSTFTNLHYGVKVQNTTPATNIYISDNDFIDCNRSIYIAGTYNTVVSKNRINVGQGYSNQQFLPYGIYSENSSAYDISNNTINTTQTSNYNLSLATGICINGTNGLDNTLYRNIINMMGAGTTVYGDNQGTNPGDGLKLICNQYGQGANGKNYIDTYMAATLNSPIVGRIDKNQGSPIQGANNFFSHTNNLDPYIKSDFYDLYRNTTISPNGSIQYYYNTITGQLTQPFYYDLSMTINALGAYDDNMCPISTSIINPGMQLSKAIKAQFDNPDGWSEEQIIDMMKTDNRSVSTVDFLRQQMTNATDLKAGQPSPYAEFIENQTRIIEFRNAQNAKDGAKAQKLYNAITENKYQEYISLPANANRIAHTDENISSSSDLQVFPNPSNGVIKMKLANAQKASYTIEVFDVFGKLIYKDELTNTTGSEFNTEINLTNLNLSNGLYLVNVNSDNQKTSQRIVIEKQNH